MVQGNKDKLVKPEGTWELFNEIDSEQKTFMAVPSEHLIFEANKTKTKILMCAWTDSRLHGFSRMFRIMVHWHQVPRAILS